MRRRINFSLTMNEMWRCGFHDFDDNIQINLSTIYHFQSIHYDLIGNIIYTIVHEQLHLDITEEIGFWVGKDYDSIFEEFQGKWFNERKVGENQ